MTHKGTTNQAILIGHLGADPDVRQTTNGQSVVNLRLATSTRVYAGRDEQGRSTFETKPEWHRAVAFGPQADGIARVFKKGMHVYVSGRLQTRTFVDENYHDAEGNALTRYSTDIIVEDAFILGLKGNGNGNGTHAEEAVIEEPQGGPEAPAQQSAAKTTAAGSNNAQPKTPARKTATPKQAPPKQEPEPETVTVGASEDDDLPF